MSIRIELDEPELAESLASYLVDAGYIARPIEGGAVDARLPLADDATASRDLTLVLRAWCLERGAPNGASVFHAPH